MARLQNSQPTNYFNNPRVPVKKSDIKKITQALRAGGIATPETIKKAAKTTPTLSKGMQKWVESNRSKLKNPTDKQDAIFKQYDKLQKEGRLHKDTGMPSQSSNSNKTENKSESPKPPSNNNSNQSNNDGTFGKRMPNNPPGRGYKNEAVIGGYAASITRAQYEKMLKKAEDAGDAKRYNYIKRRYGASVK